VNTFARFSGKGHNWGGYQAAAPPAQIKI